MFKTNKDIVFWVYWMIWMLVDIGVCIFGEAKTVHNINSIMLLIFAVVFVLPICYSKKVREWLSKEIKKGSE